MAVRPGISRPVQNTAAAVSWALLGPGNPLVKTSSIMAQGGHHHFTGTALRTDLVNGLSLVRHQLVHVTDAARERMQRIKVDFSMVGSKVQPTVSLGHLRHLASMPRPRRHSCSFVLAWFSC